MKKIIVIIIVIGITLFVGAYTLKYFNSISTEGQRLENSNTINFSGKESNLKLSNPFRGFVPAANSNDSIQDFTMVYAGVTWRDIEPQKGVFDFKSFEEANKFGNWKSKDISIVIRILLDYPTSKKHMDIPDWLYEEIGEKGTWYSNNDQIGFSPDYTNPALIENHKRLIKAFADRYDNDSAISFVQLGSVGHWGEWHTSLLGEDKESFPPNSITDIYVNHYIEFFKNKRLLMRRPFNIAKVNKMGLFNDSFGDDFQTNDYFLSWIQNGYEDVNVKQSQPEMKGFWKEAPSGGEFADYPGEKFLDNSNFKKTTAMLTDSHTSWLGPSAPIYKKLSTARQNNLDKLSKLMGYRFSVTKAVFRTELLPGQEQKGSITIKNSGVAPFYFNWPLNVSVTDISGNEVGSVDINFDIRNIIPGEFEVSFSYILKADILPGVYNISFSIKNPETGKPAINFANKDMETQKKCNLGQFTVKQLSSP
ncbi:MAG: DUF4832 domain-containing protein [Clostridiaceae bacterium]|nr:DUF4832 domain-containing protein [Clostridiaceae bacterium]